MMDTARGVKLGCDWQSIYFIAYSFDLDLKFEGSQEDREKQFEDYLIPLVMPFVDEYGLAEGDSEDPTKENLKEHLKWLEGDFTECDTLAEWCKKREYKALCYWDLDEEIGDNHLQSPVWLR